MEILRSGYTPRLWVYVSMFIDAFLNRFALAEETPAQGTLSSIRGGELNLYSFVRFCLRYYRPVLVVGLPRLLP